MSQCACHQLLAQTQWVLGGHARGMAQELLARVALEVGSNPYDWSHHPDTLTRRIGLLPKRDQRALAKLAPEYAAVLAAQKVKA